MYIHINTYVFIYVCVYIGNDDSIEDGFIKKYGPPKEFQQKILDNIFAYIKNPTESSKVLGGWIVLLFIVGLFYYICIFYYFYVDSPTYAFDKSAFLCRIRFCDTLVIIFFK
jgi:hypothetical protein